jgi:hypothetical protein
VTPSELRVIVFERDQGCVWPGCQFEIDQWNPLELAHLNHRGMGGSEAANREDNAVMLCRLHHSIFDGRQGQGKTKIELAGMLKTVVGL